MLIVKVMGGLGNQLFTYATAYALSQKYLQDLMLDEVIYQTYYSLRVCQLHDFNIIYNKTLNSFSLGHGRVGKKIFNLYHDYMLEHKYHPKMIVEQEQFALQDIQLDSNENYYLQGYWQNYRYFDLYRESLQRQYMPKKVSDIAQALINRAIEDKPIIMHIRRSDYKTFKGGKCLSQQYYYDALGIVQQRRSIDVPIWVFTDDVEFCKETFGMPNVTIVTETKGMTDIEEFCVMCHGSDYIIANSSFSWWAAYLCRNPNKEVVAPVVDMWSESFYPSEWITIAASIE